ncbi:MAG TPA: alpha-2-macroglobulin family protein [Prolixibacteraceae bacterium]|nr:alpha-2-macroglobulin family protein [Prolixibacteraceae bacterium]
MNFFRLLLILWIGIAPGLLPANNFEYKNLHTRIDSLLEKGLPREALTLYDSLYIRALAEKNHGEIIKAIMGRNQCLSAVAEEPLVEIINRMQSEVSELDAPSRQIVHGLLAENYWNFYEQNRWKIHQRTALAGPAGNDFREWDLSQLVSRMIHHLNNSLGEEQILQNTPVDNFRDILEGDSTLRHCRPTLYDMLAHRALAIIENPETGLTRPVDAFRLNKPAFFTPASQFARLSLFSSDTLSLHYLGLLIHQKLARFRLASPDPGALAELEMNRIQYLFQNSELPAKDSLTLSFYENLRKQDLPEESASEVLFRLALHHYEQQEYGKDDRYRLSLDLCREVLRKYTQTKGAEMCQKIIENIEKPTLDLEAEGVEKPGEPFRVLLSWKNMKKAYLRLYSIDSEKYEFFTRQWKFNADSLKGLPLIRTWEQLLPACADYLTHKAEVPGGGVPAGFYLLVATDSADVQNSRLQNGVVLQVSSLAVVLRNMSREKMLWVTHSETGLPVEGVTVDVQKREYNYQTRKREMLSFSRIKTNASGEAFLKPDQSGSYRVKVFIPGDTLLLNDRYLGIHEKTNPNPDQKQVVLYTDRALYRPGQIVHFKGLVLKRKDEKYSIVPKFNETIVLNDVNGQTLASLQLVSNDYGTFSGSFVLPSAGLNGVYRIESPRGSVSFRVEEYRRPGFELVFDPPVQSYSFGDTVLVAGLVKTYSGTPVPDARISCRITRSEERFWWWWRPILPEKMIGVYEVITDAEGRFSVWFADDASDIDDRNRVMRYQINADATDRNGETQSGQLSLRMSGTRLLLSCDLPELVYVPDFKGAKIEAKNLNDEAVRAHATVTITRLESPGRFLVHRYWAAPDTFLLDEKAFRKQYPEYPYREEHLPANWKKGKQILQQDFELPLGENVLLNEWIASEPGYYRFDVEATDGKQSARWSQRVRMVTEKPSKAAYTDDWVTVVQSLCEPGESAEIWLTSLTPRTPIRYELTKGDEVLKSEIITPGKNVYRLSIPIEDSYRGNVVAHFVQLAANRRYEKAVTIEVPYSDRKLEITFQTFRNELLPGEKEQWSLNIRDASGKGQAAEMVATLYDASLDYFVKHRWQNEFFPDRDYPYYSWNVDLLNRLGRKHGDSQYISHYLLWLKNYESLPLLNPGGYNRWSRLLSGKSAGIAINEVVVAQEIAPSIRIRGVSAVQEESALEEEDEIFSFASAEPYEDLPSLKEPLDFSDVQTRSNFNETAFFYPHLYSDTEGQLTLSFTIPEAITRWRFLGFAHTKAFQYGGIEKELITRKELSVSVYAPRFLRENDELELSAKVTNLTGDTLRGHVLLQWFDAVSLQTVTCSLIRGDSLLSFEVGPEGNTLVQWSIAVPEGFQALGCKVLAKAHKHSDGEEKIIPVLTNRQLVRESLPFMVRGGETKNLQFEKMVGHGSTTLTHHRYTLEYTSNPAWYALLSLPYLMEYPYECSEQVFSRFYAHSAASALLNRSPRIKAVFDVWKKVDTGTFLSQLEKNQELKSVLLSETPWLMEARDESETRQRLGLLFDINRMEAEQEKALNRLQELQSPNGGFPWFNGMPDNRYITQYIVKGMGEMEDMDLIPEKKKQEWESLRKNAMAYLDARIVEDYQKMQKESEYDSTLMEKHQPGRLQLHYLYARSFFPEEKPEGDTRIAFNYFFQQAKKLWKNYDIMSQGLLALSCQRFGDHKQAQSIVRSLSDRALRSPEEGMYWRDNNRGYFWYQSPIETQALMIQVFSETGQDAAAVEEMKIWLLRHKQTNRWESTKATLAACNALLTKGTDLLQESRLLNVALGGKALETIRDVRPEAGTGLVKTSFSAQEIQPGMEKINVHNPNRGIAWGAAYWQYFEQLDKISGAGTDVSIEKQLFVKQTSEKGELLVPVSQEKPIQVGNEVVVRVVIRSGRDMEFVHLKDMRASGFEPVQTLSGYRWQDGLGYYQEVKDVAHNFFISYLQKGSYVFEYSLRASHPGEFSNGITTLQCLYAPELATHSEGTRVRILPRQENN